MSDTCVSCSRVSNLVLDIFKFDPNYLENEEKYKVIKNEILGEESEEDSGTDDSDEGEEEGMPDDHLSSCDD